MSEFYTNARVSGNTMLYRGIADGKPVFKEIDFQPCLFVPSQKKSEWKTLSGESVEPFYPGGIRDCQEFTKKYEGVEGFRIYGNTDWAAQYLAEITGGAEVKYDLSQMIVAFLDIEVECEDGFSNVEEVSERVNAITVRVKNKRWVFGLGEFNVPDQDAKGNKIETVHYHCVDESSLLNDFLNVWQKIKPDIVTGWNVRFFDIPYLVNRIEAVLGEKQSRRLSPWKQVRAKTIEKWGQDYVVFELVGIATLDFYELYKKYTYENQESWSLGHIAKVVLGEKKLSHEEYDGMASFYKKNFQKFIEYNVHDVDLVFLMDEKLHLIELHVSLAYMAKINLEDAFSQVRTWDALIYNYLRDRKVVIPQNQRKEKDEQYAGAYVKEPVLGAHQWVVSFDLNSLYPHLIMQYNISPETMLEKDQIPEEFAAIAGKNLVETLLLGEADTAALKHHDLSLAANGQFFTRARRGFLPVLMEKMYNDRKAAKKIMLGARQQVVDIKEQLRQSILRQNPGLSMDIDFKDLPKELKSAYEGMNAVGKTEEDMAWLSLLREQEAARDRYFTKEQGLKICLNSAYGALGNQYFRFFDIRQAEAITLGGQLSIRWIENALNKFLNETLGTTDYSYIIASDTDSVYIRLDKLVKKVFPDGADAAKIVKFLDKSCQQLLLPFINEQYLLLAARVNAYEQKMVMAREVIADRGVWTAKKRYILNVHNSEGVHYPEPKLKIMGIETTRSSTPQIVRDELKKAIKIIVQGTNDELIRFIEEFHGRFLLKPPEEIAFPRSVNYLDRYQDETKVYKKSCPIAVKGALVFNKMLRVKKVTKKYRKIQEGDKIKFLYLKVPNQVGDRVLAFPNSLPQEFGVHPLVDYETHFEKAFLDPLKTILETVGWKAEKTATLESFFV